VNNIGDQFTVGSNDPGRQFVADVGDTGDKSMSGVVDNWN
jgi:hypothetical protein